MGPVPIKLELLYVVLCSFVTIEKFLSRRRCLDIQISHFLIFLCGYLKNRLFRNIDRILFELNRIWIRTDPKISQITSEQFNNDFNDGICHIWWSAFRTSFLKDKKEELFYLFFIVYDVSRYFQIYCLKWFWKA